MPSRTAHTAATPRRILVVDDEPLIRDTLAEFLGQEGFDVQTAAEGGQALVLAQENRFDLAICDIQLPGIDGVELLERLLKISPQTFVLLITAYGTVESAVEAFKRGAHDYLMKPLLFDEVLAKIRHLLHYRELHQENQWLRRELHREYDFEQIIGHSPAMQQVFATVAKVAPTRTNVLLIGESGTGKELIARAIHHQSPFAPEKFTPVNCAAIPSELIENQLFGHRRGAYTGADRDQEGIFENVGSGTVFLDEIAELPLITQAKLLRAIEQKEVFPVGANEPIFVNARIIAATNKNLAQVVEAGRFREDLFYRLNVVSITLPPLRERREDIPDLVEFLLAKHVRSMGKRIAGVDHEAMRILRSAPWRGNIRELDNALQRAVILGEGPLITPADLPPDLAPSPNVCLSDDLREAVAHFERRHLERVLRDTPDKKEAAKRLGLALSSLYRKIEELGISLREGPARAAETAAVEAASRN
jgi:DNA-binding NtrC family response regulator